MQEIQKWNVEYEKGYFQALLDVREQFVEQNLPNVKSLKSYNFAFIMPDSFVDRFLYSRYIYADKIVSVQ